MDAEILIMIKRLLNLRVKPKSFVCCLSDSLNMCYILREVERDSAYACASKSQFSL